MGGTMEGEAYDADDEDDGGRIVSEKGKGLLPSVVERGCNPGRPWRTSP